MKKTIAFFLITSLISSCKKDYSCECTFKTFTTVHSISNQTKKNATKSCEEINSTWQDSDGSCKLLK